jgi:MFS transporter, PPP family, 3-phenylpropionic acid transporter
VTSLVLARRLPVVADLSMVRPAIVYIALFAALATFFPYSSVLLSARGLDFGAIGLLLALHGVVSLVAAPAWGAVADRVGDVSRVLPVASVIAAAGAAWLAIAGDPASIAAALAVLAVGMGGMIPLADTRAVDLAGDDRERFGRARAWGSAAFIAGSIVTGTIIAGRSPDALFVLYVPLLLVTGLAARRLLGPDPRVNHRPARRRSTHRPGVGMVNLVRLPGLLSLLLGVTLIWTAVGAVMAFVSIHIVDQGGDLGTVGLVWGVGAAVEIPIMLAFPLLARRFGAERLLLLGAVAFALRAAGWALASGPILDVLVAPLGGMGFALFYVGLVGLIARSVPAEAQATAQGLFAGMTFSLGSVVGSVVAGVVAPIVGLPSLFMVAGGATLLGALVVGRGIAGSRLARV